MKTIFLLTLVAFCSSLLAQVPTQVNVEIDWMEIPGPGGHSHRPSNAEIAAVVQMFACRGITLNVVVDDTVQHINVLRMDPGNCPQWRFFEYTGQDSYGAIKASNFSRGAGWHYCVFAHQYEDSCGRTTGSSGLANATRDMIVTLGAFSSQVGTAWDRAATFAHELGHNLGLKHNGNMGNESVSGSFTPSVPSIMTYFFQLKGVRNNLECQGLVTPGLHSFKNLDYSSGITCALNENALDEGSGNGIKQIDWNCDGNISGTFAQDLSNAATSNGWCGRTGTRTVLSDYNEWANIRDLSAFPPESPLAVEQSAKLYSCMTYEEFVRGSIESPQCPQPVLASEACVNSRMAFVTPGNGGGIGSCGNPYLGLGTAQNQSGNGDVLYLLPGNYAEAGLVLNKQLTISGAGGVLIGTSGENAVSLRVPSTGTGQTEKPLALLATSARKRSDLAISPSRVLHQNFPNPFNPMTTIRYEVVEPVHVTLRIVDCLGRAISTLVDQVQLPGSKSVEWDASEYSSGVYFYRLTVGSNVQTARLILMK